MERKRISIQLNQYPAAFHPLLTDAPLYDSSCSPQAKVIFIDKDGGYYLKQSAKGSLSKEASLTAYFHSIGLATEVLDYQSSEQDWLLTARVPGEDCTHSDYLADPKRLCDTLAARLRVLHEIDPKGCPITHTENYLATAEQNYRAGMFDPSYFPARSADEAWKYIERHRHLLKTDTLLHGDYCLPNIMLDRWNFTGFIDLGNGGVGDRHVDLFWGAWSLNFNLKTDQYRERFFDAYGKEKIEPELLKLIGIIEVFG